jgi:hypothetical protein
MKNLFFQKQFGKSTEKQGEFRWKENRQYRQKNKEKNF